MGETLLLNKFFPIVDTWLSCKDIAEQSCAMVPRWRIFASLLRRAIPASRVQHVSDLHPKFGLKPHHVQLCISMVDIQSATAEIRRGKKKRRKKKKPQGKNIMSASATQGGHKYLMWTGNFTGVHISIQYHPRISINPVLNGLYIPVPMEIPWNIHGSHGKSRELRSPVLQYCNQCALFHRRKTSST